MSFFRAFTTFFKNAAAMACTLFRPGAGSFIASSMMSSSTAHFGTYLLGACLLGHCFLSDIKELKEKFDSLRSTLSPPPADPPGTTPAAILSPALAPSATSDTSDTEDTLPAFTIRGTRITPVGISMEDYQQATTASILHNQTEAMTRANESINRLRRTLANTTDRSNLIRALEERTGRELEVVIQR